VKEHRFFHRGLFAPIRIILELEATKLLDDRVDSTKTMLAAFDDVKPIISFEQPSVYGLLSCSFRR
jgi:hypothetical protein